MAFADKYKVTIEDWEGATVVATIQEDLFTGTVEEFTATGGRPIVIEHQGSTNIKESCIIPSQARISFYVNDAWDCHDLLYSTDRQHKVIIKRSTVDQFVGWVVAGVQSEDYDTGRYKIELQATDGLIDLKSVPYLNSGALYDVFKNPSVIISECLAQTGLSLAYWENIDIYATAGMTTTVTTNSPLNQSYIHTKAYGETIKDVLSCWDVLEQILQAFSCRLCQSEEIDVGATLENIWIISKIDKLASTETYREFNAAGTSIISSFSLNPLISMGATYQHVGGNGTISVQQGFKEINLKGERGYGYNTLVNDGQFNDAEFTTPPQTTLTNWNALNYCKLLSTWSSPANNLDQVTIGGKSAVEVGRHSTDHSSGPSGANIQSNGGNVEFLAGTHALTTSDWICVSTGQYRGIWKVISVVGTSTFTINATFIEAEFTRWFTVNNLYGIESDGSLPLKQSIALEDNVNQGIEVEIKYNADSFDYRDAVIVVLIARQSAASYKTLNNEGYWSDYNANEIQPIIIGKDETDRVSIGDAEIKITGSLNSSVNNFYATLNHNMYLGLYSTGGAEINYYSAKISITNGSDKEEIISIDTDYIDSKKVTFKHTDAESVDNDEYRYINAIRDDSIEKLCVNSWKQDGGAAANLEDIHTANLAAAYGTNSQIWSGNIKGDLRPYNAVKIPLNLDRVYQIQRLSRDMVNRFNSVSLIEIEPSEAYYIELASYNSGTGIGYFYLSTSYPDLSALFTAGVGIKVSDIRRKSDGALVNNNAGIVEVFEDATYTSGRVVIPIEDPEFIIDPSTSLEVKGILRIL